MRARRGKIFVRIINIVEIVLITMSTVFTRIVELIGWGVLGVSVLLLVIAHHIDNYQPPEPIAAAQKK
ncbi:hypothetical protein GCM10011445_09520 [Pseudocitrobacter faecalis]|nr:hypothetical protein GCM10011445_09520 [Pseudocitrobacter faecalis]